MRALIVIWFALLFSHPGKSQSDHWEPLGDLKLNMVQSLYVDTVTNDLFAAGRISETGQTNKFHMGAFHWNGQSWDTIGLFTGLWITAIAKYEGEVYFGGDFDTLNGSPVSDLVSWNGNQWDTVPGITGGIIYNMRSADEGLYVMGSLQFHAGQFFHIGLWNDSVFVEPFVQGIPNVALEGIWDIFNYNGETYLFGQEQLFVGWMYRQDGGIGWQRTTHIGGGSVFTMDGQAIEYKGDLYFGGLMVNLAPEPGTVFSGQGTFAYDGQYFGNLLGGPNGDVKDLVILDDELIVAGNIQQAGMLPVDLIARWTGSEWCSVDGTIKGRLNAMVIHSGNMVIAGALTKVDGYNENQIFRWKGGSFSSDCDATPLTVEPVMNVWAGFNLFPNPVSGNTLTVQWDTPFNSTVTMRLFDIYGREVLTQSVQPLSEKISIDMSTVSAGTYMVQLYGTDGSMAGKVIVVQ